MKVPERYYCDLCNKEISKNQCDRTVFVTTDCDWTEGRSCKERIETVKVDICDNCLIKSMNLQADYRGTNIRFKEKCNE